MSDDGRKVGVIGVPTSAGAFAPGQEQAPAALRDAALVALLRDGGIEVSDYGDRDVWRWRPDRKRPHAQNLPWVVEIVDDTAARVVESTLAGEITLVLGGDCTVGVGTVAGHAESADGVGLIYFDLHADLNVPASAPPGALDWMGMAHMLGEEGAERELVEAGPRAPLLAPEQVILLGWGPEQARPHERETIARLGLETISVDEVRVDPEGAASRTLASLTSRVDRFLVHFDVDVVDFTDTPLSENPGRNEGIAYEEAAAALAVLLASPALAGVTVTELNPNHVEEGAGSIERLARDLASGLTGSGVSELEDDDD
ncbi:MAG TPA: arginase family protein [Solirubrobacterales bacterium]|nr:arginase family protein [Solirubrobacterales bacterium]